MHEIPLSRPKTVLLDNIDCPSQLRLLSHNELKLLCNELRQYLLYSVGQSGGHLGAGLGVIELTVALHSVFHTPTDSLVWDVGHQSYPHKILTGRREAMTRIRHSDGPAPFPTRDESPYDSFGTGHSSTSISAALGMALAKKAKQKSSHTVAIIGDGGLTAGMAFEALNHAGACAPQLLVVLNDNAMSISQNVGALASNFATFFSSPLYTSVRSLLKKTLQPLPELSHLVRQVESHTKGLAIPPSALFEAIGCQYFGPVDGHDLLELCNVLRNIKNINGVCVLHVRTIKGKGFNKAESDPVGYHALGKIAAIAEPQTPNTPTFSHVFGNWLSATAATDSRLHAITPAMSEGSGLVAFAQLFAERYHDVGIAEQHALTLAAGMACEEIKPVVAIYSSFLQRAYDQLIHDICLQNVDVTLAIDRAGLVGEDGPTHHGVFDLSYLRCIPNLSIGVAADEADLKAMLTHAYEHPGPSAVRYPRGATPLPEPAPAIEGVKAQWLHQGATSKPALLVFGSLVHSFSALARSKQLTLINMRYLKPLDSETLDALVQDYRYLAVIEDNVVAGGGGSAIGEYVHQHHPQWGGLIRCFGVPDAFIPHGTRAEQLAQCGLTPDAIAASLHLS